MSSKPNALGTLRPILVLVVICMIAGVLLGFVHSTTKPVATANAEARAQQMYSELVPEAASFEPVNCSAQGCVTALKGKDGSGSVVGTIIVTQAKGYGGDVQVLVAFDEQGNVKDVDALPIDETPGLGTRVSEDEHIKQYVGLPPKLVAEEEINFISGATISSRAVHEAFNYAVQAYEEVR